MARRAAVKVLHLSFSVPPHPPGGTEIYVAALCRELDRLGTRSVVAAPGLVDRAAAVDGLEVREFVQAGATSLASLYGRGDRVAADAFDRLLDAERPDVVHQHALTPACSVELARRVKKRALPLAFTYHTPTVSCVRGTLLRWGHTPCDGDLATAPCAACLLQAHGLPPFVARLLAALDPPPAWTDPLPDRGGVWTAVRLPALVREYQTAVRELLATSDAVVALSPWVRALLVRNGVPPDRIVDSPHGVAPVRTGQAADRDRSGPLRLVHLGRVDGTKGTRLLLDALARCPDAALELDVIGVPQGDAGARLWSDLSQTAQADRRVRMLPSVDHTAVIDLVATYDALVVPSQWMESGPLVVLEAFAAGVPVIGSDLGGIAEKVRDGVDGWLVRPFHSVTAWSATLARCAARPERVRGLGQAVRVPRAVADVARDMHALYGRLTREMPRSGGRS